MAVELTFPEVEVLPREGFAKSGWSVMIDFDYSHHAGRGIATERPRRGKYPS